MGETGIFDLTNTSLIFWEVITFLILLALLRVFVYPQIRAQIVNRQRSIEEAIDDAERTREEAHRLLEDYRRQLEEARSESRKILDDARKQGDAQQQRAREEAREESNRIVQQARADIERERDEALRELREEVADMVIQASEQVLGRSVEREDHDRLIAQALDELEGEISTSTGGRGGNTS
jgi:F-type H+-transporting ATPase subunit b